PTLTGSLGRLSDILTRYQKKLISGASDALLAIWPVFFTFIKAHRAFLGRPFDDHKNPRGLSLAFDSLHFWRASQVPAAVPLHHPGHILDVNPRPSFGPLSQVLRSSNTSCAPLRSCSGRSSDR